MFGNAIILLSKKQVAVIDYEDLEWLNRHRWHAAGGGYAGRWRKHGDPPGPRNLLMHRAILGEPDGIADHINRNKLDNRRVNLRVTDKRGNALNAKIRSDNTSGCTGVTWCKRKRKWKARYSTKSLGYHRRFEDAVAARKAAEEV